ncbi:MAG: hypothetical protein HUJ27_09945 [Rhodobacteraceae bacterium]|nr:hypothetical protein [Paracoccaceae bacterium]
MARKSTTSKTGQSRKTATSGKKAPVRRKKPAAPEKVEDAVVIEETKAASDAEAPAVADAPQVAETEAAAPDPAKEDAATDEAVEPSAEDITPSEPAETPEAPEEPPADAPSPAETKAAPPPAPRRGSAIPAILGGAVAALIGFGAAQFAASNGVFLFGAPAQDDLRLEILGQAGEIDMLTAELSGLADRVNGLPTAASPEDLEGAVSPLASDLGVLKDRLAALDTRLSELESRPPVDVTAPEVLQQAYEHDLAEMRQVIADELKRIERAQAAAAEQERVAARNAATSTGEAAVARITAALESGASFVEPLADLEGLTGTAAPGELSVVAESGLSTLSALQDSFPDAARAALDASIRAAIAAGEIDRMSGMIRLQLGTRSLSPQEGDDPDAILSRAEAALREGKIGVSLDLISTLPDAGQNAMSGWVKEARTRQAAEEAFARYRDSLTF